MQLAEMLHFSYTVFDSLNVLRHLVASEPSALASHPRVALMTKRKNVRFGPVFDRKTGIQTDMLHTHHGHHSQLCVCSTEPVL
jgi:hypothetical protein